MTEKEIQNFIEELNEYGSVFGTDTMKELLKRMGNPEEKCKVIHVAGTNGKGSVVAYVSTVLTTAGYKTGRYTSPAIFEPREIIRVDGKNITEKAWKEGWECIEKHVREMQADGLKSPTLFEAETALAFWYFAFKECDFAVLETGLGGREDATNVVTHPLVCVLTSISMDHMAILGNTLEKIAREKAGIIKKGATVVSGVQEKEAMEVIGKACKEFGCYLRVAQMPRCIRYGLEKQTFSYENNTVNPEVSYKKIQISLAGICQPENAAVALEVLEALKEKGIALPLPAIEKGMKETRHPGRFSILQKKPLFLMDGAHNEAAAIRLRESLELYFSGEKLIFILGVLKDKEYEKIIAHTADFASHIITVTPPENPRALPAYELAKEAEKVHPLVTTADSIEEAVEIASLLGGGECAMIAFGSLSYLGRLKKVVETKQKRKTTRSLKR